MNNLINNNESITIILKLAGTSCNMSCLYCYEHVSDNKYYGCNDYDKIVKYLRQYEHYKHVFIVFHGGEPLLVDIKLMKKIFKYIFTSFSGKCQVQIQTNGTLLNDEWIELMKEYIPKVSLSISLEPKGKKDLRFKENNKLRKKVVNNIKKYINCIPNLGIVSVAHAYNLESFIQFIQELIDLGVPNLTINKYHTVDSGKEFIVTEKDYVNLLKNIFTVWVSKKWYLNINIQPLLSLFSNNPNKICTYLPNEKKCFFFRTFYNEKEYCDICDHINFGDIPSVQRKCLKCDIYMKCGGGCLAEIKDSYFCEARKELFEYIEEIKYGNKRIDI